MKRKYRVCRNSHWVAKMLHWFGIAPNATSDIGGDLSLGYGRLDDYGFWQFQLVITYKDADK